MKRADVVHTHTSRIIRQLEILEMNAEAATLAPLIAELAERHKCSPLTITRIALAHLEKTQ